MITLKLESGVTLVVSSEHLPSDYSSVDAPQYVIDQLIDQIDELNYDLLSRVGSWIVKNKELDPEYMGIVVENRIPFYVLYSRFYNPTRSKNSSYQVDWSTLVDLIYPTLLKSGLQVVPVAGDTSWHLMIAQIYAIKYYGATQDELDQMAEFYHWDRSPGSPYYAGSDICLMIRYGYLNEGLCQETWNNALRALGVYGYHNGEYVVTHPTQIMDRSDYAVNIKMPILIGKLNNVHLKVIPIIYGHVFDPEYPDVVPVNNWTRYQIYLKGFQGGNQVPMNYKQYVDRHNLKEYNPKDYLNDEWRNNYTPKKLVKILNIINNYVGMDISRIKLSPKQFKNCLKIHRTDDLCEYLLMVKHGSWSNRHQAVLDKFSIVALDDGCRNWLLSHLDTDHDLIMRITSKWKPRWANWNLARVTEELKNEDLMINEDEYDKFRARYGMPEWDHRPQKWLASELLDTVVSDDKYTIKSAALDDIRVVRYGYETHCCQHFGGAAEGCMRYGLMEPTSWFLEIRSNLTGQLIGQGWYWVDNNRNLVIDNIELANDRPVDSVLPILKEWASKVGEAYMSVVMGCGYNTIITADMNRIYVDTTVLHGTYTDARTSVVLAGKYCA